MCGSQSTNSFLHGGHVPSDVPHRDELYGDATDALSRGNACIAGPDGDLLAGPLVGEEGMLVADLDFDRLVTGRQQFDPVGHYARGDVLRLTVDARPAAPVTVRGPEPDGVGWFRETAGIGAVPLQQITVGSDGPIG